jgi:transcriptional regulator with GAF, ATPase, and Fis domain
MLAVHFLEQVCRDFGRSDLSLTQKQVDAMRRYDWPGNIRELKNVIERAVILSPGKTLRLDLSLRETGLGSADAEESPAADTIEQAFLTDAEMKSRLRDNLVSALNAAGWRISGQDGAAELLGMKPSTLADRMRALGVKRPDRD